MAITLLPVKQKELADKIVEMAKKIKAIYDKIFTKENLEIVLGMVNCFQKGQKALESVYKTFKGIYDKVVMMIHAGPGGIGLLILDLVCAFSQFRKSIEALIGAIKETDTLKKFHGLGKFVGFLLAGLGAKKFRKLQLYSLYKI